MTTSHLNQPHFQDSHKAREYLARLRWPNGPVCPHCGVESPDHYELKGKAHRPGLFKCKDCREQFSVTVGTVFERSKISLNIWLQAVFLLCSSKKGMSAHQLHRTLGVTYKTAWFMAHRIREAMKPENGGILGGAGGSGIVEADETYWGNNKQGYRAGKFAGGVTTSKMKIFTLVERNGKSRSFHVPNVTGKTLKPIMLKHIDQKAHVMTDEASVYARLDSDFPKHSTVIHSKGEYARGNVTTNTVEGFFSILKRGLVGTYHHVSEAHLQRYCDEFDFRYSTRSALEVTDKQRTDLALKGIAGKRLTYRRTEKQLAAMATFTL
jgi:transposase-like protein